MTPRARFNDVPRTHAIVGVKGFARVARTLALRLRRTAARLRPIYEAQEEIRVVRRAPAGKLGG